MIFGTDQYIIDARTGIRYQVCIVDAVFPGGQTYRMNILADEGDGYFFWILGLGPMRSAYELQFEMWFDREKKTAVMFPKHCLMVIEEKEVC